MEGVFFCMDCRILLRNGSEIMEHLRRSEHSYFVASDRDDHHISCAGCQTNLSSVTEVEYHSCEVDEATYYVETLPVKDPDAGFMTPNVRPYQGMPGAPRKRKENPTPEISMCDVSDDENDEFPESSEESDDEDDEDYTMFQRRMPKKEVPQMESDSDKSDYEDDDNSPKLLSNTRTLKNMRNPRLFAIDRQTLRKKYIIAEALPREKALKRVKKAIAWYEEYKLLSRPLREVAFDSLLGHVCLERVPIPPGCPSRRLKYKPRKTERMMKILRLVEDLLEKDGIPLRENTLHYTYPDTFAESELKAEHLGQRLSKAISEISLMLKLSRESLRLRPSPKGLIHGEVKLYIEKNGKEEVICDGKHGGESGNSIPSEADEVTRVEPTGHINYVLVIEKDTIFHRLTAMGFAEREECILICGKGQPDVATRAALRKLNDRFSKIPFYALVDCNPSGIQIFLTYCFGAEERSHDNISLTVPELQYIGMHVMDVDQRYLRELTKQEKKNSSNIIDKMKKYIPDSETRRCLEDNLALMNSKGKADLDLQMGTMAELLKRKIENPRRRW